MTSEAISIFLLFVVMKAIQVHNGMQSLIDFSNNIQSFLTNYNFTYAKENEIKSICYERIQQMIDSNIEDPLFPSFLRYSGKRFNDIGNYLECSKTPNMTYFIFVLQYSIPEPFAKIGFCLPEICTEKSLYDMMNDTLMPIISKFTSILEGVPITVKNSKEFHNSLSKDTVGFYITIILFIIWLSIVLFATLKEFYYCLTLKIEKNKVLIAIHKYTDCFSLKKNIESLVKTENKVNPQFNALQFLRCICIYWIVVLHTFLNMGLGNTYNMIACFNEIQESTGMAFIRSATVAVDVFFTLSGFLSAMSFISNFEPVKKRTLYNLYSFYANR